ncbi:MAG TPA: hypothetical protein VFU49_16405 [Ktedonobacteraceae bacterium]|nr:hypothetical protein [Ktedonobacteraceae bacterium]
MMPQMDAGEPMHGQANYGGYEGSQGYAQQQQYGTPYSTNQQPGSPVDDNLVEAVAQRVAQIVGQGSGGKVYARSRNAPTIGMKLALAIVSLCLLIPLAAILISGVGGIGGLIGFGGACLTVIIVNVVFNESK